MLSIQGEVNTSLKTAGQGGQGQGQGSRTTTTTMGAAVYVKVMGVRVHVRRLQERPHLLLRRNCKRDLQRRMLHHGGLTHVEKW